MIERIGKYIKTEGISVNSFEKTIGASPGVIRKALKNNTNIHSKWIEKIIDSYPNLNYYWLLTGKGSIVLDENESNIHLNKFKEKEINYERKTGIPLINQEGIYSFIENKSSLMTEHIISYFDIPVFKKINVDFLIQNDSNVKIPKYNKGDILACKILSENDSLNNNKPHLILTKEHKILFNKIQKNSEDTYLIVSQNRLSPSFKIHKSQIGGIALISGFIHLEF
ncbi:hypothetical protein OAH13_01100 [Flavobacteriaceae bacterium]|nr:hypothetical protein [Flavobacteriaceae bacterium]